MSCRAIVALVVLLFAPAAQALPTMVRLGYAGCAACHMAPQGGGLLTDYGRGIDDAQSLRAGEYVPPERPSFPQIRHDVRALLQARGTVAPDDTFERTPYLRVTYRNATDLLPRVRVTGLLGIEYVQPAATAASSASQTSFYVGQAQLHYRPTDTIDASVGRDQLPSGLNLPDLSLFIRARTQMTLHDYPLQAKVAWWSTRAFVSPYVFAPLLQDSHGRDEWGGGALGEYDLSGQQLAVVGINLLGATRSTRYRQLAGTYARLGFGVWGLFAEHDVTRLDSRVEGEPTVVEHASYLQPFVAVREWLVLSLAGEHLYVSGPTRDQQVAGKLEVAMRLAPPVTLVLSARDAYAPLTRERTLSATAQLYIKTAE